MAKGFTDVDEENEGEMGIIPVNLSKEPIFCVVTDAYGVSQVFTRIQLCIPLPQSILPKPANFRGLYIFLF